MIEYDDVEFEMYDLDLWIEAQAKDQGIEIKGEQLEFLKEKIRMYPPIPAKDMLPPWYTKDHILRHCYGIRWVTSRGYLVRAPINFMIHNFMIKPMTEEAVKQGFPFENGDLPHVFKCNLPWMIRSKDEKPIDILCITPAYHFKSDIDIRIQPGILAGDHRLSYEKTKNRVEKKGEEMPDFLKDPFGEEVNPLFCSKPIKDEKMLVFKEGYPMVQLIPIYK
jgi:hypothetical protein